MSNYLIFIRWAIFFSSSVFLFSLPLPRVVCVCLIWSCFCVISVAPLTRMCGRLFEVAHLYVVLDLLLFFCHQLRVCNHRVRTRGIILLCSLFFFLFFSPICLLLPLCLLLLFFFFFFVFFYFSYQLLFVIVFAFFSVIPYCCLFFAQAHRCDNCRQTCRLPSHWQRPLQQVAHGDIFFQKNIFRSSLAIDVAVTFECRLFFHAPLALAVFLFWLRTAT
jgi:hypothetical protein